MMPGVFLISLLLAGGKGVVLNTESRKTNATGKHLKAYKLAKAVYKGHQFMQNNDLYDHYHDALVTHWDDVNDLHAGSHPHQSALQADAAQHPYVYAFVNINLAAGHNALNAKFDNEVNKVVRNAQRRAPGRGMLNQPIQDLGDQFRNAVHNKYDPDLVNLRDQGNIAVLRLFANGDTLTPAQHSPNGHQSPPMATGKADVIKFMKNEVGLGPDGQAAMMALFEEQWEKMHGEEFEVQVNDEQRDFIDQTNDNILNMVEYLYGGLDAACKQDGQELNEVYDLIHEALQKDRKVRASCRDEFFKQNVGRGMHLDVACDGKKFQCFEDAFRAYLKLAMGWKSAEESIPEMVEALWAEQGRKKYLDHMQWSKNLYDAEIERIERPSFGMDL